MAARAVDRRKVLTTLLAKTLDSILKYRTEIDGLRAVAVLPVIFFHAGLETFSGGFVGVDVFFVISGFLITSIIINELENGKFSLIRFYERRARRIIPALFLILLSTIPLAWIWLPPTHLMEYSKSLSHAVSFTSNFFFYGVSSYFDTSSELKPLLHLWSLAVEEQYYLIFPAIMIIAWKIKCRNLAAGLSVVALASLGIAEYFVHEKPELSFFLLPTRIWEILAGATIASIQRPLQNPPSYLTVYFFNLSINTKEILALTGLLLIIFSTVFFKENTPTPGIIALIPVIGAMLIISYANPACLTGKILSSRPLTFIGAISYSAYLWHQPIFAFAHYAAPTEIPPLLTACLIAGVLLLATLTWKFIETPFRNNECISRTLLIKIFAPIACIFLAFSWAGKKTNGFEDYYYTNRVPEDEKSIYNFIKRHTSGEFNEAYIDNGDCNFRAATIDEKFIKRFEACAQKYGKAIIILGDSHAINIYNALQKANYSPFLVGIAKGGCRPHNNKAKCQYDNFDKLIQKHRESINFVVYHQSGSYYLSDNNGKLDSPKAFEADGAWFIHKENISLTKKYLDKISNYVPAYWLGPFPEARVDFHHISQFKSGYMMNPVSLAAFRALEKDIQKATQSGKSSKWNYISLYEILKIDTHFLRSGECLRFRDADHLSACGEDTVGAKLKEALSRLQSTHH